MREGLCDANEQEKCKLEFGEDTPELEWACKNCPKKRQEDLSPYTLKLLQLRTLRAAGYPMQANDITYQEWMDLGRLCLQFDQMGGCPLMGGGSKESGVGGRESGV